MRAALTDDHAQPRPEEHEADDRNEREKRAQLLHAAAEDVRQRLEDEGLPPMPATSVITLQADDAGRRAPADPQWTDL
jgi:hypothetical protein